MSMLVLLLVLSLLLFAFDVYKEERESSLKKEEGLMEFFVCLFVICLSFVCLEKIINCRRRKNERVPFLKFYYILIKNDILKIEFRVYQAIIPRENQRFPSAQRI